MGDNDMMKCCFMLFLLPWLLWNLTVFGYRTKSAPLLVQKQTIMCNAIGISILIPFIICAMLVRETENTFIAMFLVGVFLILMQIAYIINIIRYLLVASDQNK